MAPQVVAIFWAPDSAVWPHVDALMNELHPLTVGGGAGCRVKDGLLLSLASDVREKRYSARVDSVRLSTGWLEDIEALTERGAKERLLDSLHFVHRSDLLTYNSVLGANYFCTVFSSVSSRVILSAVGSAGILDEVHGVAEVDMRSELCHIALWEKLVLRFIIVGDQVLEAIPDSILDFGMDGDNLADSEPDMLDQVWKTGFFAEEIPGWVFLEKRFADLRLPPDVERPARRAVQLSPARQLLRQLPDKISKIHKHDDSRSPSSFKIDDPRWEWPDPAQVLKKVNGYCLDPAQKEQKWLGFSLVGFIAVRSGDGLYLSSAICSGLMNGIFDAYDMKVAADGTAEFTVHMMIAGRWGKYWSLVTAWNAKQGRPIALSSAFVSLAPPERSLAMPLVPPRAVVESLSWDVKFKWAREVALEYGGSAAYDGRQSLGWLWVPHSDPTSKSFALWLGREFGGNIYRRVNFGGRVTLISFPPGITGVASVVASVRLVQVCLGLFGVRTFGEVEYD